MTTLSHAYGSIAHVSKVAEVLDANTVEGGLCVLFQCSGFLDSHSHPGKFIILLKNFSQSYLISLYRLLLEQRQSCSKQWQRTQRAGSYSILSVNLRLQQSYGRLHTPPILDCITNCRLFPFSRKKIRINQTAFALCCISHSLTFLLSSSNNEKMKPRLATGRFA